MNIYVDELPKDCIDCPFYKLDTYVNVYGYQTNSHECVLDGSMLTNSCPLHSISYYSKQVRKEVVEFIDKCFEMQKYESIWINPDKTEFSCDVGYAYEWWESFRKILLNKLQGEDK